MGALGVQLLLFGGFEPRGGSGEWQRRPQPPASLQERVDRITPTWKAGGRVDYSWPPAGPQAGLVATAANDFSLFDAAAAPALADAGATVRSLVSVLDRIGLRGSDFDAEARAALREMSTWQLPRSSDILPVSTRENLTLLVLSFDATPACRAVTDCARPGPSNELLAATAERFVRRRWREHGQSVQVVAQWEVAAAMRNRGMHEALPIGTPGIFENTAKIFEKMSALVGADACDAAAAAAAGQPSRVVLLTHPDHLRRALRIGETTFGRLSGPCRSVRLAPAMQAYTLDWPTERSRSASNGSGGLNLYKRVSGRVHTQGEAVEASWYDDRMGYFPDGDPQQWVHRREVWCAYEFWARAKGVVTGVIGSPADGDTA